jgi:hypothetical protein
VHYKFTLSIQQAVLYDDGDGVDVDDDDDGDVDNDVDDSVDDVEDLQC